MDLGKPPALPGVYDLILAYYKKARLGNMVPDKVALRKTFYAFVAATLIVIFLLGSLAKKAEALMTVEEEKKLGEKVLLEIRKSMQAVRDPTLQSFLDRVGGSLVAQVSPTPFEFNFNLIKNKDPNAFAIPGGQIFVTTGLLTLAENDHEVAGVLGHEIGHVTQRHVAQLIDRSKRLTWASLAGILAGVLAGRAGGAQTTAAAAMMSTALPEALLLKYTRENESEADQKGLETMIKAGYDPNGMIAFLNRMYKIQLILAPNIPGYLLTHPAIEDRIVLLENILLGLKPQGPFKPVKNLKWIQTKALVEEMEPSVAVSHFESIVKTNPDDVTGLFGLGVAFRRMGRLDKSVEVLQNASSLASENSDILTELGIAYFLSGKLEQAVEKLEAARSSFPSGTGQNDDLLGLYYLGRTYQERGDFAKALPLFLKVKNEMPEYIDVYFSLGSVYGRMEQQGLSHFYFAKHFKMRGEMNNALLHFRAALEWLERGSPERDEAQREIRELAQPTKQNRKRL